MSGAEGPIPDRPTGPEAAAGDLATAVVDGWYDPAVGLVWDPPDPVWDPDGTSEVGALEDASVVGAPAVHLLPHSTWYWLGLLRRNGPGDAARADATLETILGHQYDRPGTAVHGTFSRFHESPDPGDDPVMWVDYDPNWRQFIGCGLLVGLAWFGDRLGAHAERIDRALTLAAQGEEAAGRLPDNYANIALMHAFLLTEAGRRLGEQDWVAAGEARARRVAACFDAHGAFDEYNSPTYYGIDLFALGLWRGHAHSPVLAELGARIEAALWRDIARWYHAGLTNLAGPYTRAYGMDMRAHVAALGWWVAGTVGLDGAPLPDLSTAGELRPPGPHPVGHRMDAAVGVQVPLVGTEVPAEVIGELARFSGERTVTQRISGPDGGDRVATGWLAEEVMLGAESNSIDLSWWDQFHAATAHWADPGSPTGVGWLRAMVPGPSDAEVSPGRLVLRWHHGTHADEGVRTRLWTDRSASDPARVGPLHISGDGPTPVPGEDPRCIELRPGPGEVTEVVIAVP